MLDKTTYKALFRAIHFLLCNSSLINFVKCPQKGILEISNLTPTPMVHSDQSF